MEQPFKGVYVNSEQTASKSYSSVKVQKHLSLCRAHFFSISSLRVLSTNNKKYVYDTSN